MESDLQVLSIRTDLNFNISKQLHILYLSVMTWGKITKKNITDYNTY